MEQQPTAADILAAQSVVSASDRLGWSVDHDTREMAKLDPWAAPRDEETVYEYGIARYDDALDADAQVHRTGMTKEVAQAWIEEFVEDTGPHIRDVFYVIRRPVSNWERAE